MPMIQNPSLADYVAVNDATRAYTSSLIAK